jgi:hypothetical protein
MIRSRVQIVSSVALAAAAVLAGYTRPSIADDAAPSATSRPLLQELDRESRALVKDLGPSIVRVQLPSGEDPLAAYSNLNPAVLQMLRQAPLYGTARIHLEITPATQPTAQAVTPPPPEFSQPTRVTIYPNCLALVIDDKGHVLVPGFIDQSVFAGRPVPVVLGNGMATLATYVGSDKPSNLTILALHGGKPQPAKLGSSRPEDGSLTMVMPLNPAGTRLSVWTSTSPDSGLVVQMDGTVAGFAGRGLFLPAGGCMPVAKQLIEYGHVQRARLGVAIVPVSADDALRASNSVLGMRGAIRVMEVEPDSAAKAAGLLPDDLILSLAGRDVGDTSSFASAISISRGPTKLQILRGGEVKTITVELVPKP